MPLMRAEVQLVKERFANFECKIIGASLVKNKIFSFSKYASHGLIGHEKASKPSTTAAAANLLSMARGSNRNREC
jgi:hypothetical protein